jgi:hypothetical protein
MSCRPFLFTAIAVVGALAAFACQSAVNLDVKYTDAGASDASADGQVLLPDGAPDPEQSTSSVSKGEELEGCPCDLSQGLACCVSGVGPPFCTTDQTRCASEKGAFFKCFNPDPTSESVCCWTGSGENALTAYAAECKNGRLTACTTDQACPGGGTGSCHTRACKGVLVGACGVDPPACPPGT